MDTSSMTELTFFRGRVGLYAMLKALGVGEGDEVAIQAFTCLAVPEAVLAAGARPLYVDIEPDGVNMNGDDLAAKLTPRTRAVVAQHTYGIPARMDRILDIAARAGLPVLGDCCHTFLSTFDGTPVPRLGAGSFFSYEWGKPVIVGVGGSVLINDDPLRRKVQDDYARFVDPPKTTEWRIRMQYVAFQLLYRPSVYWTIKWLFHATSRLGLGKGNFNPIAAGDQRSPEFTWRMSPHHRRLLARKIQQVELIGEHARRIAALYDESIHSPALIRPVRPEASQCTLARYPLLAEAKDELLRRARDARVELSGWYATPIHPVQREQWPAVHYHAGSCPNAERNTARIVTLPLGPKVDGDEAARIIAFLNAAG